MTPELRELYQDVILDHGRRPRNFKKLSHPTHTMEGFNPLCGDKLSLYLTVKDDVISDVGFEGAGCAISMASASLMCEHMKNKTVKEAQEIFSRFHRFVTENNNNESKQLGKLTVLSGVKEFPVRVKCATLPWHTLSSALAGKRETVTTE